MTYPTETLAYTAGIFDGEGSVNITCDADRRHYLRATVTNTNEPLLSWLRNEFGGNVRTLKTPTELTRKSCYTWSINGSESKIFLEKIFPFVKVKKEQITLALSYPVKRWGQHCSPVERKTREEMYIKMRQLNRGGIIR